MVLKPLEFSDCLSDSPWFRQNLRQHEVALEDAYKNIKTIETQCREVISCTKKLSNAQKAFSDTLSEFKFETVGTNQTDDERVIGTCLKEFSKLFNQLEDQRMKCFNDAESQYLDKIKKFRTEGIGRTLNDEKRKYEKESTKFYQSLEKHLHLSTVRKNDFREADAQLDMQQHNFCKASLQYVAEIQSVQERMKFEFVEVLSSLLYSWLTFYHMGHVIHDDFKPFLDSVHIRVQKTRDSYNATIREAEVLKDKMLKTHTKIGQRDASSSTGGLDAQRPTTSTTIKQGYVYMQEKSKIPNLVNYGLNYTMHSKAEIKTIGRDVLMKWTKYYCVYSKETRIFTMIPVNSAVKADMKGALGQSISFKLKECVRRSSDSIDKRFCFDLLADERPDVMTFQALSEDDRRQWIEAMDGKQAVFSPGAGPSTATLQTQLDETGFDFVDQCLGSLEDKGIREQGLYRNCGVTSKVQKLMQLGLDKRKTNSGEKVNLLDDAEWEIKTISSAVKTFLRNLPEPLMTFDLHNMFINAAKMDDRQTRVSHIHYYVHQLPAEHKRMLEIVVKHLRRVADRCEENLMTVGNLGVCFGPTLLRPKEETMAAIMDIKFCNVVVEVLIANCEQIFDTQPPKTIGQPCPPKPDHKPVVQVNSAVLSSTTGSRENRDNGRALPGRGPRILPVANLTPSPAISAKALSSRSILSGETNSFSLTEEIESPTTHRMMYGTPSTSSGFKGSSKDTTIEEKLRGIMFPAKRAPFPMHDVPWCPKFRAAHIARPQNMTSPNTPRDDSSDSLNSLTSHGSESPRTAIASASLSSSQHPRVDSTRAKLSTSYAPAFNPQACEACSWVTQAMADFSVYRVQAVPVGAAALEGMTPMGVVSTLDGRCDGIQRSASASHDQRTGQIYSSFINPIVSLQPSTCSRRVKTLYACTPDHETELSFQPGQIITNVYESKENGWLVGTLNGKTGLIPSNYVEPLP